MLRNTLKSLFDEAELEQLGIPPSCRAGELSLENFVALADCLSGRIVRGAE
jgi:16S rRNA A1518/A1519 N6-dimethyltransferase RsmA/KsgA/DIM1 with predicted DNA glycosylase/AP lyase activity